MNRFVLVKKCLMPPGIQDSPAQDCDELNVYGVPSGTYWIHGSANKSEAVKGNLCFCFHCNYPVSMIQYLLSVIRIHRCPIERDTYVGSGVVCGVISDVC